jgi:hypothetical protein
MKQKKTNTLRRANILSITGIAMLLLAPFIQDIFITIAGSGCPQRDGRPACGFDPGLALAFYAQLLPIVWLAITSAILITATVLLVRLKRKS